MDETAELPRSGMVGHLLAGASGAPCLFEFAWWTRRGEHARQRTDVLDDTLSELTQRFGQTVLHVFDRGYASQAWLGKVLTANLKGLIRWHTHYRLLNQAGESIKTWEITRGKRSVDHRLVYDTVQKCHRKTGIIYQPVRHPAYPGVPLYLIVSRPGKGRTLGICSLTRSLIPWNRPGRWCLPMPVVGRLRRPFAIPNRNWLWNLLVCGSGKIGSS